MKYVNVTIKFNLNMNIRTAARIESLSLLLERLVILTLVLLALRFYGFCSTVRACDIMNARMRAQFLVQVRCIRLRFPRTLNTSCNKS